MSVECNNKNLGEKLGAYIFDVIGLLYYSGNSLLRYFAKTISPLKVGGKKLVLHILRITVL